MGRPFISVFVLWVLLSVGMGSDNAVLGNLNHSIAIFIRGIDILVNKVLSEWVMLSFGLAI